jgi:hypothetical protein
MVDLVRKEGGAIGNVELNNAVKNEVIYGLVENANGEYVKALRASLQAVFRARSEIGPE